jgi:hypothetical protein
MNPVQNTDSHQKFLHDSFPVFEGVVTVGVGVFLLLVWILMSPLLRLSVYLRDWWRTGINPKKKDWF